MQRADTTYCSFAQAKRVQSTVQAKTMSNSKPLQLSELNQRSAPIAEFDVAFYKPKIDNYEYIDRKTKKQEGS